MFSKTELIESALGSSGQTGSVCILDISQSCPVLRFNCYKQSENSYCVFPFWTLDLKCSQMSSSESLTNTWIQGFQNKVTDSFFHMHFFFKNSYLQLVLLLMWNMWMDRISCFAVAFLYENWPLLRFPCAIFIESFMLPIKYPPFFVLLDTNFTKSSSSYPQLSTPWQFSWGAYFFIIQTFLFLTYYHH